MRIEIVNVVAPVTVPTASGSYQKLEVAYKNQDGKVQGKSLVSYSYPEVFNLLKGASRGDQFDVTAVKEGKYWNWTNAVAATGPAPAAPAQSYAPQSPNRGNQGNAGFQPRTYETKEERDVNRTRISRQAVLNTANAFLALSGDKKVSLDALLSTAETLEKWVTRSEGQPAAKAEVGHPALAGMKDDIPF